MKNIPGESVSERFRNAVKFADPEEGLKLRAYERQLEVAKNALYRINVVLNRQQPDIDLLQEINNIIEGVYWMVEQ
jgi:hypothetical protein